MTFEAFMRARFPEMRDGPDYPVTMPWLRGFWLCALKYGSTDEERRADDRERTSEDRAERYPWN